MNEPMPAQADLDRLDEETLAWLLDVTSDAISVRRLRDGRLVLANQSYAVLTGQALEDLLGRSPLEAGVMDEETFGRWLRYVQKDRRFGRGRGTRARPRGGRPGAAGPR